MKHAHQIKLLTAALLLAAMLATLKTNLGNPFFCQETIAQHELYDKNEILEAMNAVQKHFLLSFKGCTLLTLKYSDDLQEAQKEWAEQYHADEVLILISSFKTGASGCDGSMSPNTIYSNWQWILTRSTNGKWTLQTWGY